MDLDKFLDEEYFKIRPEITDIESYKKAFKEGYYYMKSILDRGDKK